jgi:hypothetical protein
MGHLYGVNLVDAVTEIREAAFRMRAAGGASQGGGAGGPPPPNGLVVVAPDADAICASIIIERVLTGEKVLHDIAPVAGYTEVVRKCRAFGPNLRSVVLINCGAGSVLSELLWPEQPTDPAYVADWWSLPDEAHVYVLDVHRPFNHHNVRNVARVTVLDLFALPGEGDDVPRVGDSDAEDELEYGDEEEEDEAEEGEEEADEADEEEGGEDDLHEEERGAGGRATSSSDEREDEEGGGGAGGSPRRGKPAAKRRRLRRAGGDGSEGDDSEGDGGRGEEEAEGGSGEGRADSGPVASPGAASRRSGTSSVAHRRRRRVGGGGGSVGAPSSPKQLRLDEELRAKRRAAAERHRRYYSGNHYGTCAALVAYEIAELVRRTWGRGGPHGSARLHAQRIHWRSSPPPSLPLYHPHCRRWTTGAMTCSGWRWWA